MPWTYQNWGINEPRNKTNYDYVLMTDSGAWEASYCDFKTHFLCETPERMIGPNKMAFRNTSLINWPFHFWWNNSMSVNNESTPGFKLNWQIENGSLPDVMELVSKYLEGSDSTPGLGSLPRQACSPLIQLFFGFGSE